MAQNTLSVLYLMLICLNWELHCTSKNAAHQLVHRKPHWCWRILNWQTDSVELSLWELHKTHKPDSASSLWFQITKMVHNRFYFTSYRELKGGPADFTPFNMNVFHQSHAHHCRRLRGRWTIKIWNALNAIQCSILHPSTHQWYSSHSMAPAQLFLQEKYAFNFLFCHF